MKKAATSATVGRNARAGEAARVRRAARATKASRAAQAAVVTALGAGLLLHGGQASAATATSIPGHQVVVTDGDEPGPGSGSGGATSASSGDSGSGDSGSGDSGSGDSGSVDSGSVDSGSVDSGSVDSGSVDSGSGDSGSGDSASRGSGSGDSGSGDAGSGGAATDGSAGSGSSETSSEGSGSGVPGSGEAATGGATSGPQVTDSAGSGDPGTGPTDRATVVAPALPQAQQIPSSAPVAPEAVDPAPSPRTASGPVLIAPLVPEVAALARDVRSGGPAAGSNAAEGIGQAVVATVPSSRLTSGRAPATRVSEAVAQNPITRLVLALVGVGPDGVTGAPTPAVPTTALLVAQWALFRRGENSLFNQTPVAPGLTGAPTTGRVEGSDPDGDRLTYTLLDGPSTGDVVVNADGTYVYTPNAELARTGGTDTFTVLVRDNDPAAPGLGGFTDLVRTALSRSNPALAERLFGAHTTVATVTVQVEGTDTGTPAPAATPVVNPTTGVVTGRFGPGDDVPRTYTVTVPPQYGTLTVDDLGHYVYTPTEAARRAAALTPGADVDTVTVTVSDRDTGVATARTVMLFAAESGTSQTVTLPISELVTGERTPVGQYPSGVVLSADGRYAAVRSTEGVTVVDSTDGRTFRVTSSDPVNVYAFSRDGSRLVVTSGTGSSATLRVVSTADGAVVHQSTLAGDAQLSPDGRYVFVTRYATPPTTTPGIPASPGFPGFPGTPVPGQPGSLSVIDTQDGSLRELATGNFGGLRQSPDGRRAYAIDQDSGNLVIVDTATATVVRSLAVGTGAYELVFSPDGTRAYIDGSAGVTVVRVADDTSQLLVPGAGGIDDRAFSPDGRYLLVPSDVQGRVVVVDVGGDRVVGTVDAGYGEVVYSPDSTRAVVTSYGEQSVTVIDLASATGTSVAVGDGYRDVVFSPDGARAYVTSFDGTVMVIDTATADVVATIPVAERSYSLTLSPDGTRAYAVSTNDGGPEDDKTGDLTVIDLATGTTTVVAVGDRPGPALVSPDGRRVYVVNYYDETLSVIDTSTNTVIGTVEGPSAPDVALTPDGRFAYVTDLSRGVILVSTADDTVTFIPASNISTFDSVRFSPDGRYLYVESYDDGQLVTVDLDTVGADGDATAV